MAQKLILPVKGTRDFYPEEMAFRNWLYDKVKEISRRFGYREYDGPEIEYLDLYANKTSEEILREQVFTLKDRDDRELALRPELTPTFARMVAQRANELPRPIRWFSFGRFWRYEQPQKGRGREAFQWEINILGPETPEADAEILVIAATYLKELGLSADEVVIRVSDREYLQNELKSAGIPPEKLMTVLRIIDRREKMSDEKFLDTLHGAEITVSQIDFINKLLGGRDYTRSPWLTRVFESLKIYEGVLDYIQFDPLIVRGFDYYTRTVFEAWDKTGQLKRAIFGGGRFDNLTAQVGGARVPGVGMAPGDMPIRVLLEQFNKMPALSPQAAQVLVTVFAPEFYPDSLKTATNLRNHGIPAELWVEPGAKLDKQLKYADQQKIPFAVIIGPDESAKNTVTLKNLSAKSQETLPIEEAINKMKSGS